MSTSHQRGHEISYTGSEWVYSDTREPITVERPCIRCGKLPTEEGYDACLGHINGARSACCGHGVTSPFVLTEPPDRNQV
jgi:hypothetical protein